MKNQTGQVILILVLVMTVALAIGISVVQRSLSDISTASKVEQSSRAFSAAEAGIEKSLLTGSSTTVNFSDNNSQADVTNSGLLPAIVASGTQQNPLECPLGDPFPLAKEDVAQVWLADYTSASNPPPAAYIQNSLDVFWGNSTTDPAALELTLIYHSGSQYQSKKWFIDHNIIRSPNNNFTIKVDCTVDGYTTASGASYACGYRIGGSADPGGPLPTSPSTLMMLRARLLYNNTSQPFAVQAVGTCGANCSVPPQTRLITATGTAGQTQRKIQVCQAQKVIPPYFDYAIFSTGAISK